MTTRIGPGAEPTASLCSTRGPVHGMTYGRFLSAPENGHPCSVCRDADAAVRADGRGPRLVRVTAPGVDGRDFRGAAAAVTRS